MNAEEIVDATTFVEGMRYALGRFDWGKSALDAESIGILNEWERKLAEILKSERDAGKDEGRKEIEKDAVRLFKENTALLKIVHKDSKCENCGKSIEECLSDEGVELGFGCCLKCTHPVFTLDELSQERDEGRKEGERHLAGRIIGIIKKKYFDDKADLVVPRICSQLSEIEAICKEVEKTL